MTVEKRQDGAALTIALAGRLDTATAPELETQLREWLAGVQELTFDLSDLQYVSSAGLRILLIAQKMMHKQGSMTVRGVSEVIREIFTVTGFADILTIV